MTEFLAWALAIWFLAKSIAFGVLWRTSRQETPRRLRSDFGRALSGTFGSLAIVSIELSALFLIRAVYGRGPYEGEVGIAAMLVRGVLFVTLFFQLYYDVQVYRAILNRRRQEDDLVISEAALFSTMAQAMPIIVVDQHGTIQYTTTAFESLARAEPDALIGKDLKTIMPERYWKPHDAGVHSYLATGNTRIIGRVVTVEMLRLDGTECPVYLALNTADVDEQPWFVGSMWKKEPDIPDALLSRLANRDSRYRWEDGL